MNRFETNEAAIRYVAERMRVDDFREISLENWTDGVDEIVHNTLHAGNFVFVFGLEDEPIVVIGAIPVSPTNWSVFMWATDRFDEIGIAFSKWCWKDFTSALLAAGMQRAECRSRHDHIVAHRWLDMLGAKREGVLRQLGKDGSDYIQFSWTKSDVQRRRGSEKRSEATEGSGGEATRTDQNGTGDDRQDVQSV